jgi:hypothetical protein
MADGFQRASVLEGERGHDRGILRVCFSSAPNLGAVDEDLGNPAVVEPADAAGVNLAPGLEPVEPMRSPVRQLLAGSGDGHGVIPSMQTAPILLERR